MEKKYNLLVVNRYPITAEVYKDIISNQSFESFNSNVSVANTLCCASEKVSDAVYDLLLLDTNLFENEANEVYTFQSFKTLINNKNPLIKIIVITSYTDNLKLLNILNQINPDGLLLKSDITKYDLRSSIKTVCSGNPFYSNSINKLLRKKVSQNVILDIIDTNILKELSNGSKMAELLSLIPLTKSGIEKRKRRLRSIFQTSSSSDRELVITAREKGFI